jgi:fermentation-respiration switch protein FrsA (DUF1100 family)
MNSRSKYPVLSSVAVAVALYAFFIGALYYGQRALLYHPNQKIPVPEVYGVPEMSVVKVPTTDGLALHAWWRAPTDVAKPIIVYYHGNAGHIGDRAGKIRAVLDAGYGVLFMSYRYNAGVGGTPSEAGLFLDGEAAIQFLTTAGHGVEHLVMYGESLGSGVAVEMAARHNVAAVVLEAPYTNMADVAQHHYWYTPARWLLKDRFDSASRIRDVKAPVLVFHGGRDRVIPDRYGRGLYDVASQPKEFHFFENGAHNDLYDHGAAKAVLVFLERNIVR